LGGWKSGGRRPPRKDADCRKGEITPANHPEQPRCEGIVYYQKPLVRVAGLECGEKRKKTHLRTMEGFGDRVSSIFEGELAELTHLEWLSGKTSDELETFRKQM